MDWQVSRLLRYDAPGEGVVGRVRRLRGPYGVPGREGGARPCRAEQRPVSTCRRRDRLIAPRGRRDGSGLHRARRAGMRQVVATIDVARAKPATGMPIATS
jgi:hypothetical protein